MAYYIAQVIRNNFCEILSNNFQWFQLLNSETCKKWCKQFSETIASWKELCNPDGVICFFFFSPKIKSINFIGGAINATILFQIQIKINQFLIGNIKFQNRINQFKIWNNHNEYYQFEIEFIFKLVYTILKWLILFLKLINPTLIDWFIGFKIYLKLKAYSIKKASTVYKVYRSPT